MHPKAGRVHKDFEGRGIYKKLDDFTTDFYKSKGSVLYKAISLSNTNQRLVKKVEDGSYKVNFHRVC